MKNESLVQRHCRVKAAVGCTTPHTPITQEYTVSAIRCENCMRTLHATLHTFRTHEQDIIILRQRTEE